MRHVRLKKVTVMAQVNNRKFNFNNLKILQWNANSSYFKYTELSKNCEDFNLILISETWLSPHKSLN